MRLSHAVVLAGGLGTRIQQALGATPKALAPIGSRTLLDLKLKELERNGIETATFLLGYGADEISAALKTCDTSIQAVIELDGDRPLGTGGALVKALEALPRAFFVTYGDSLLEWPYENLLTSMVNAGAKNCLAVTETVGIADAPNSFFDGRFVRRHNKSTSTGMNALDYGVMILNREDVRNVSTDLNAPFGLDQILSRIADRGLMAASLANVPYWEVGTPETLRLVQSHFDDRE